MSPYALLQDRYARFQLVAGSANNAGVNPEQAEKAILDSLQELLEALRKYFAWRNNKARFQGLKAQAEGGAN